MRAAILQMCSSDRPEENTDTIIAAMSEAKSGGAVMLFTPEVSNCVSLSREHQRKVLRLPEEDANLERLKQVAADLGIWLHLGSWACLTQDADGRFANRSLLISDQGEVTAWYDKIHMFDVEVTPDETFRESDGYRPGDRAVVASSPLGPLGLSICYDMRFAYLYRDLAQAGARVLTAPAAFSPVTGAAHWHALLRTRAIETGCFVIAAAQTGAHRISHGKGRSTYGHSLVVAPWGEVLLDGGEGEALHFIDIDPAEVDKARVRVPALTHDRPYTLVT